jgi:hypothetical protein
VRIGLYDETKKACLCTADVSFSTDTVMMESCEGMDAHELEGFLLSRAVCPDGYGAEEVLIHRFRLEGREHEFGRLQDAPVLYAMLNHFRMPNDTLAVYPLKNEVFSMIGTDCRFTNLYTWRHIS